MVQKFSKRERVYLTTTLLRTDYDRLTDLFQKRRIMEDLQGELRQHFRGNHSITQIQRRWSDMKRRERSFVREVQREHVPDAQMPPRQRRGREHSDEAQDQPPPLDVGEAAGPSNPPADGDDEPPDLEAEEPHQQEVAQQPQAGQWQQRHRNRRAELASICRQLSQVTSALQNAIQSSSSEST